MDYVIYVVVQLVKVLVVGLELAMFARAILSLFGVDEETPLGALLYYLTEPVIMPVRALFERLGWFQNLPIDLSFLFAFMILSILGGFL